MSEKETHESEESRAPVPWRPFAELEPWPSPFGQWLFSGRLPRLTDELRSWPWPSQERGFLPALDVDENDKEYRISIELAGVKKDDVHIELHDGTVTIRGEKTSEHEEKKERRRYVERSYGSFSRSFRLPSDADVEHLDASFEDGVLSIKIPKTEESKPRTISIK